MNVYDLLTDKAATRTQENLTSNDRKIGKDEGQYLFEVFVASMLI